MNTYAPAKVFCASKHLSFSFKCLICHTEATQAHLECKGHFQQLVCFIACSLSFGVNMWDSGYTHSRVTVFIPCVPFHAQAYFKVFSFQPPVHPTSNGSVELY